MLNIAIDENLQLPARPPQPLTFAFTTNGANQDDARQNDDRMEVDENPENAAALAGAAQAPKGRQRKRKAQGDAYADTAEAEFAPNDGDLARLWDQCHRFDDRRHRYVGIGTSGLVVGDVVKLKESSEEQHFTVLGIVVGIGRRSKLKIKWSETNVVDEHLGTSLYQVVERVYPS